MRRTGLPVNANETNILEIAEYQDIELSRLDFFGYSTGKFVNFDDEKDRIILAVEMIIVGPLSAGLF